MRLVSCFRRSFPGDALRRSFFGFSSYCVRQIEPSRRSTHESFGMCGHLSNVADDTLNVVSGDPSAPVFACVNGSYKMNRNGFSRHPPYLSFHEQLIYGAYCANV